MTRLTFYPVAPLLLLLAALPLAAQTATDLPAETIEEIEAIIRTEMSRQSIPGLSLAIAIGNNIRYANGFGLADLENSVPVKATTVFRTASIAKPMTATAVMRLAEQDKLDLDAPIQEYCPAFPEKRWPITARQLLGHLGGIRSYTSLAEATGTRHYPTVVESLALFKDDPLLHEPGTKYTYSSYGYNLLGCAIEGASGMPYEDYMRENVFRPAGMSQTRADNMYVIIPHRARGYFRLAEKKYPQLPAAVKRYAKAGELYNAPLHDTSMKLPAAGFVSTAVDLAKFAIAVQTGSLLKKTTLEQMWTRQKTRDGKQTDYGLGWSIAELEGQKVMWHPGALVGVRTQLTLLPDQGIAIVVMANRLAIPLHDLVTRIAELLLQAQVKQGSEKGRDPIAQVGLARSAQAMAHPLPLRVDSPAGACNKLLTGCPLPP